ncbi:hypothetical protein ACFC25_11280 [Pseudarthrobacter sp. NPDC055928]|uniref:hypothetical protein n=1 Tax=Pseudarthrobacter sp. NPDC055928 TaxID=3345661 RepID=UPI0035DD666C
MISQYYRHLLSILGFVVAACSSISVALLWAAPPPTGLKNIDPAALKATIVLILAFLGVVMPLAAIFTPALRWLVLKATVFAVAGLTNAVALSPELAVPFQDTTSVIAVACGLGMAVVSILAFMDSVQKKNPQSKF